MSDQIPKPDRIGYPPAQPTPPKQPNGRRADQRLIEAITALSDQFAVCGLEQPVAIIVKPGQSRLIQAIVMQSPYMLFEDARCKELQIWGVPIREVGSNG